MSSSPQVLRGTLQAISPSQCSASGPQRNVHSSKWQAEVLATGPSFGAHRGSRVSQSGRHFDLMSEPTLLRRSEGPCPLRIRNELRSPQSLVSFARLSHGRGSPPRGGGRQLDVQGSI